MTRDERERIRTNLLGDHLVRKCLAGFLHQELRNVHGADIPSVELERALRQYVMSIDRYLELAEQLFDTVDTMRKGVGEQPS